MLYSARNKCTQILHPCKNVIICDYFLHWLKFIKSHTIKDQKNQKKNYGKICPCFFFRNWFIWFHETIFLAKFSLNFFPNQTLSHCTCHDHMYVRLALGFLQHYNDNNFSCSTLLAFATLGILSQNYILLTDGRWNFLDFTLVSTNNYHALALQ